MLLLFFCSHYSAFSNNSLSPIYTQHAGWYDHFYCQSKNYMKESLFLHKVLSSKQPQEILDVGCGTGTHMKNLEGMGYQCVGIDINDEMLNIARAKVKGEVFQADMREFNLARTFDAAISMFQVFNHNLTIEDALQTLLTIKNHLVSGAILVIDLLSNPHSSAGVKTTWYNDIKRVMRWKVDSKSRIFDMKVTYIQNGARYTSTLIFKLYSIVEMKDLLKQAGYNNIRFYDNYTLRQGTAFSQTLIAVAQVP